MHSGTKVVRNIEYADLAPCSCLEVVELAIGDVLLVDDDVDVAVWSTLLVPEANSVSDLVSYCAILNCYTAHNMAAS